MNFKSASLLLAALASYTFAAPASTAPSNSTTAPVHKLVSGPPSPESAQDLTHVFICTDANFAGRCQNLESTRQGCYTLFNGFSDTVSSIGPDQGTTCVLYDDAGCSGASLPGIVFPGINNLDDFGFNDRASSYRCN